MGFGQLFLGFMFLYDFQLGLRHEGATEAYAMIDIFPDLVGWLLIFFGVRALSNYAKDVGKLKKFVPVMFLVSLFTLAKDTVLFSVFYDESLFVGESTQNFFGEMIDFSVHLLEIAFILMLFQETAKVCRKYGEDKLSRQHLNVRGFASAECFLYVVARIFRFVPLPESLLPVQNVISMLDLIFIVVLVWYGAIALFRALMRVSD